MTSKTLCYLSSEEEAMCWSLRIFQCPYLILVQEQFLDVEQNRSFCFQTRLFGVVSTVILSLPLSLPRIVFHKKFLDGIQNLMSILVLNKEICVGNSSNKL